MTDAIVSEPYVKAIHVEYKKGDIDGYTADVSWDLEFDDINTTVQRHRIDVKNILSSAQKTALEEMCNTIAESDLE